MPIPLAAGAAAVINIAAKADAAMQVLGRVTDKLKFIGTLMNKVWSITPLGLFSGAVKGVFGWIQNLASQILNLGGLIGVAFSVHGLVNFVTEVINISSAIKAQEKAIGILASNLGLTGKEALTARDSMVKMGASLSTATDVTATWVAAGLKIPDLLKLTAASMDIADARGKDWNWTLKELADSTVTTMTRTLEQLGLGKDSLQLFQEYAKVIHKNVNELSDFEKKMSIYNYIVTEATKFTGTHNAVLGETRGKLSLLSTTYDTIKAKIGEVFGPTMTALVDKLSTSMNSLGTWIDARKADGTFDQWAFLIRDKVMVAVDWIQNKLHAAFQTLANWISGRKKDGTFHSWLEIMSRLLTGVWNILTTRVFPLFKEWGKWFVEHTKNGDFHRWAEILLKLFSELIEIIRLADSIIRKFLDMIMKNPVFKMVAWLAEKANQFREWSQIPAGGPGLVKSKGEQVAGYRISAAQSNAAIHYGTHEGPGVYDVGEKTIASQGKTLQMAAQEIARLGYIVAIRMIGDKNISSNHLHFADPSLAPEESLRLYKQAEAGGRIVTPPPGVSVGSIAKIAAAKSKSSDLFVPGGHAQGRVKQAFWNIRSKHPDWSEDKVASTLTGMFPEYGKYAIKYQTFREFQAINNTAPTKSQIPGGLQSLLKTTDTDKTAKSSGSTKADLDTILANRAADRIEDDRTRELAKAKLDAKALEKQFPKNRARIEEDLQKEIAAINAKYDKKISEAKLKEDKRLSEKKKLDAKNLSETITKDQKDLAEQLSQAEIDLNQNTYEKAKQNAIKLRDERLKLAHGNKNLVKEVTDQFDAEMRMIEAGRDITKKQQLITMLQESTEIADQYKSMILSAELEAFQMEKENGSKLADEWLNLRLKNIQTAYEEEKFNQARNILGMQQELGKANVDDMRALLAGNYVSKLSTYGPIDERTLNAQIELMKFEASIADSRQRLSIELMEANHQDLEATLATLELEKEARIRAATETGEAVSEIEALYASKIDEARLEDSERRAREELDSIEQLYERKMISRDQFLQEMNNLAMRLQFMVPQFSKAYQEMVLRMQEGITKAKDEVVTLGDLLHKTWKDSMQEMAGNLSDFIAESIVKFHSFKDFFKGLGDMIVSTFQNILKKMLSQIIENWMSKMLGMGGLEGGKVGNVKMGGFGKILPFLLPMLLGGGGGGILGGLGGFIKHIPIIGSIFGGLFHEPKADKMVAQSGAWLGEAMNYTNLPQLAHGQTYGVDFGRNFINGVVTGMRNFDSEGGTGGSNGGIIVHQQNTIRYAGDWQRDMKEAMRMARKMKMGGLRSG